MMNIALISFTSSGLEIAERLKKKFEREENSTELINKETAEGKVSEEIERLFKEKDAIIFISSAGIAVRMIAPFIVSKTKDPAVAVIDDLGRYSISLLSGHIGGANALAEAAASELGAEAVITTASDGRNIDSADMFAIRNGYIIGSMEDAKTVTQAMVEGKKIALISEKDEDLKYGRVLRIKPSELEKLEKTDVSGVIAVSSSSLLRDEIINYMKYSERDNILMLIPREIYVGVGCRRNTSFTQLKDFIEELFEKNGLDIRGVKAIGSIDLKANEFGLIELAEYLGAEFRTFSKEELLEFEDMFSGSEFVKKTVGVSSVSETAAYKMSRNIIADVVKRDGMTVTIGKERVL